MDKQELIEKLSDKEHASWANWQSYFFSKCQYNLDGSLTVPLGYVEALQKLIDTPYTELSEQDKQHDRDEVAHILPIIREYALSECGNSGEMSAMAWGMSNANNACISDLQRQVHVLHDEIFCTDVNRPRDSNKTLLGHVNNLYRLIYSLQGEEAKEV